MQPRTRKMKKKSTKPSGYRVGNTNTNSPGQFRTLNLVFPPRMLLKMRYFSYQAFTMTGGNFNYRWRPTAAFDVDPALGGTSMAGFAEMAAQYATYRVIASRISVSVANPSATTPMTVVVLPTNADPGSAFGAANIIAATGNPYAKTKITGLLGSPPTVIRLSMTTQKMFGDSAVLYDHNFSSLVTTVPSNNWFWNVCLLSQAAIATAPIVTVTIEVDTEFFDRTFLPA